MFQIEGLGDFGLDPCLELRFMHLGVRYLQRHLRRNYLNRAVALLAQMGAQAFMPCQQGIETALQCRGIQSALEAQGARRAGHPTGFRRLTPGLLKADRTAERFSGLPDGVTMHGQLLAAFKAAAPRLGLSPRMVHAIDWLFRFTMPQDWGRGGRPIVWPSASTQQEALGLSPTRVKAINRALIEAGLITMRDSPNGKRYGKRDPRGHIVEAYGFDLSPIAARHAEFVQIAREAKEEREELRRLRRRATIGRNGIAQILETAAEYGFQGEEWPTLRRETRDLTLALRKVERPEEVALGVESLERRQRSARERLENLLAQDPRALPEAILTPHPGEAARLLGCSTSDIQADRFTSAQALAERFHAVVVLKGAGSIVAAPGHGPRLIAAGNPGMAVGGMGDLLTGIIASLRAQGLSAFDAAATGALLHALAGDIAAADGARGLLPTDLLSPLRRLANPELSR